MRSMMVGSPLVVVAPHPDDEALGAGGLISFAARQGVDVHVVLLTSGDGFRQDAERYYMALEVTSEEYIHLAYERQQESRRAMGRFGIAPEKVHFLGFPDGGLDSMWLSVWRDHTWQSPTTKAHAVHYLNAYAGDEHHPYQGHALFSTLTRLLEQINPSMVVMPHPMDQHPDHWAAGAFATLATWAAGREGRVAQRFGYLVHWPGWPLPPAYRPQLPQVPPDPLTSSNLPPWYELNLSVEDVELKRQSLMTYESQVELIKPFLLAFARRSEVYQADHDIAPSLGLASWAIPRMDRLGRWMGRDNALRTVEISMDRFSAKGHVELSKPWRNGWRLRINCHLIPTGTLYDWWWPEPAYDHLWSEQVGQTDIWWTRPGPAGWETASAVMVGVYVYDGDRMIGRSPVRVVAYSAKKDFGRNL